jgi:EmrB/QacA subfamily drug resistance transporter
VGTPLRFRPLQRSELLGLDVPVAATRLARLLGLALLPRWRAGPGLLIPRCRSIHTFGMRFPLDLLFLDAEGRVLELRGAVPPGRFVRCRGAAAVLELPSPSVSPAPESNRQWWVLVGTCLGLFILMLDSTVVALALPTIEKDLHASADNVQWVLNGYLLVISILVVTAGRLGDIAGRRLIFLGGMAVFGAGSVLAAVAWDDAVLVAARAIQGIGGAAMLSLSLAIVSHAFPVSQQGQALGIWAAVSALALAVGPLVGGVLIDIDWRLIFWINLPICAAGIAITSWAAHESRDETSAPKLDYPGLATLTPGLLAVVFALVRADDWGWGSARTLGLLGAGIVLLAAFWSIEHRVSSPIVDFSLFRNGPYLGASAAAFALVGAYWAVIFFQPQYLQEVLDHGPVGAGVLVLPITAPMVFISPFCGPLIKRLGPRILMTAGMLCGAVGLALLTRIGASSSYGALLPGYLLFGISLGLVYAPMSTAAMLAMPRAKAGIAAGVLAMVRVTAGALALAVAGAVFQGIQSDQLAAHPDDAREAFATALAASTWVLAGLVAVGTILTWALVRRAGGDEPAPEAHPHHLLERHRLHL